jgi:hypothetical protein
VLAALRSADAYAQACCAAPDAVTPVRLAPHEELLIGAQMRGSGVFGSYGPRGSYAAAPEGTSEQSFRQELLVAVRFLKRGQFSLLVPLVETRRVTPRRSELGGGFGDANIGARYDLWSESRFRYAPGLALLAGATLPTGVAPESASKPLLTDATGIGALQLTAAVALEKMVGPVMLSATGLVSGRMARSVGYVEQKLAPQWSAQLAVSYWFRRGAGIAASAVYAGEGNAAIAGSERADSARRLVTLTASGILPLSGRVRGHAAAFVNPPASHAGANQLATAGLSLAMIYTLF